MHYEKLTLKAQDVAPATLEAYIPAVMTELGRQTEQRPAVLLLPGGGYRFVSDREAEPVALHLLSEGYNVFILTYGVAPQCYPTQLLQVAAAMEKIAKNAVSWHTDPQRVALMGFSAGGHLAAHYANGYDLPAVRQVFPDSKPVAASVLCYPVITADPEYTHTGTIQKLAGGEYPREEDWDTYACERMVSEKTPPTFLWHCTGDKTVPVQNSLLYAKALADHHVPFRLQIYPGGKHGMSTCDKVTANELLPEAAAIRSWLTELKSWLKEVL